MKDRKIFKGFFIILLLGIITAISCFGETAVPGEEVSTGDINQLLKEGKELSDKDAAKLEKEIKANPTDLSTRTKLLGYYYSQKSTRGTFGKAFQHLKWIIKNHPASKTAGHHITHVSPRKTKWLYKKVKKLWLKQVNIHRKNAGVIGNAGVFFYCVGWDKLKTSPKTSGMRTFNPEMKQAEVLFTRARALDPESPKWPKQLGGIYLSWSEWLPANHIDLSHQKRELEAKALKQLETSINNTTNKKDAFRLLINLARAAIEANESEKAKIYAEKLLNQASGYKEDKNYGRAIHYGNLVLGRLALKSGDKEKASGHLIEAGKTPGGSILDRSGPDTTLAKELLALGFKEPVIKYFQLCANFWKRGTDRLNSWITTIEQGGIPGFDKDLKSTNTAIFTTGLNEKKRPIDNIEKISINDKKIYIYTYWNSISNVEHQYLCKIFDGSGKNVFNNQFKIIPQNGSYYTYTWYNFNKNRDKHSNWRFEVYLDGEKKIEKNLVVLDQAGQKYDAAKLHRLLEKNPLLKKSAALYQSVRGYRDTTIVEQRTIQQGKEYRTTTQIPLSFEQPNRIGIEYKYSPSSKITKTMYAVFSDGEKLIDYMGRWNQYIQKQAPTQLTHRSRELRRFSSVFLLKVLMNNDPARSMLESVEDISVQGHEKIDGTSTTILELTQTMASLSDNIGFPGTGNNKTIKVRLWIGDNDALVHQISYQVEYNKEDIPGDFPEEARSYMEGLKLYVTEKHTSININPVFPADTFTFKPPQGAKHVTKFESPQRRKSKELVGRPAPGFLLKDIHGSEAKMADFKGKVLIVDFWATWCGPCKKEMPTFVNLQSKYSEKGFTVIAISTDKNAEVVRKFADKHKLNFTLLMADEKVRKDFGDISAIPTTYVIDKKGIVRYYYIGATADKLTFQKNVEELLEE